ncbi:MAG: cation:proton antiporter [Chloroflexota bacterium]|nr:cation:proton antiporter [Chloroflexota bacterium]
MPTQPEGWPQDAFFYVLLSVAIILILAQIMGRLAAAVGQPRVVGEIIAGLLIGPTVLGGALAAGGQPAEGLVGNLFGPAAGFLALTGQIGLIFYMFLVGMELDQSLLRGRFRQIAVTGLAVVLVPIAFGFLVGALLTGPTWVPAGVDATIFSMFVGAALSVTAFPVMARILQEKGLIATPLGATGVGAAALVTVLMFLAIAAANALVTMSRVEVELGLRLGLTVAFVLVLLFVVRPVVERMTTRLTSETLPASLIGVLLAGAVASGLIGDRIGISALVGGFLFGLVIPGRLATPIIGRMQPAVVLFFLPIFLAFSGLRTDLKTIGIDLIPGVLLVLTLMIVGKWGVGYVVGRATGLPAVQAHVLGVLLNCRGLLILVVALRGLELGVITPAMQAVFVIGAIVTTVMTGPLTDYFLSRERRQVVPETGEEAGAAVAAIGR